MRCVPELICAGLALAGLLLCSGPAVRRVQKFCFSAAAARQWQHNRNRMDTAAPGEPCAWLKIHGSNISLPVLDGIGRTQLVRAPCREQIGEATLILAHRDTHFRGLKSLRPGDKVELELRGGLQRTFRITESLIVDSAEAEKVLSELCGTDRLILATCYPFRYTGPAPSRIFFIAEPV